jgi:hypothetical protein
MRASHNVFAPCRVFADLELPKPDKPANSAIDHFH